MTLTDDQVKLAFERIMGMPPRSADVMVIQAMGSTSEVMAEYLWDHWMGEPDEPTEEQVEAEIIKTVEATK